MVTGPRFAFALHMSCLQLARVSLLLPATCAVTARLRYWCRVWGPGDLSAPMLGYDLPTCQHMVRPLVVFNLANTPKLAGNCERASEDCQAAVGSANQGWY